MKNGNIIFIDTGEINGEDVKLYFRFENAIYLRYNHQLLF
jgi:hypothetical protein